MGQAMNDNPLEAVRRACGEIGTASPDSILVDSIVHRYHDSHNDRPGQRNGWYIAHHNPDGTTGGTVGSWKLGTSATFCTSCRRPYTSEEKARFAKEQAEARQRVEAERLKRQADAAAKAVRLWRHSRPAVPAHAYLVNKGVCPHRARQTGAALVLDYRNNEGIITTLQFIQPDGSKRFLAGGEVAGSSHRFGGKIVDTIILAEGFATGATLHEASGHPVAVCGSAGNLRPVALGIRARHPGIHIIIAGDGDPVGRRYAIEAAEAVNGVICLPDFEVVLHGD